MSAEGGGRAEFERAPGLVGEKPVDGYGFLRFTHRLTECSFEVIKRTIEETIHNRHGILVHREIKNTANVSEAAKPSLVAQGVFGMPST